MKYLDALNIRIADDELLTLYKNKTASEFDNLEESHSIFLFDDAGLKNLTLVNNSKLW
jgi:hypothetical protein